jgi:hypothetical protein
MRRIALTVVLLASCTEQRASPSAAPSAVPTAPSPSAAFSDNFDRTELGPDWSNTGGPYRLEGGALRFEKAHNHPLWLTRPLPADVQIDLDVTGSSPDGDLKVELMGDGQRFESDDDVKRDAIYTASGYRFIFGGWRNRLSTIARQNEHTWQQDPRVPRRMDVHVEPGRTYHWTLTKRGGHLEWLLDGKPFLSLDDATPLQGPGHDRFGFDGWETGATFDNLKITPL